VFLDACDTSRARNEDGGDDDAGAAGVVARAQGLAAAFVYAGAHACVGSLWPVFDDSAQAFAASFYESLFRRDRIGDALSEARCRSRTASTDRLTWASYALYGDPLHRLRDAPRPPAHQAPTTPPG
jgi:CHAT domain-containing protein